MSDTDPDQKDAPIASNPVVCLRCKQPMNALTIDEFADQSIVVRADTLVLQQVQANCPACGWSFYWTAREKDTQKYRPE